MEFKSLSTRIAAVLTALAVMLPATMSAYDFEEGGIYYDVVGSTAKVTYKTSSGNSYTGIVVIPESVTHNGVKYPVTAIGNGAFSKSSGLTDVDIPNSIVTIGDHAFASCTGLRGIVIPNSVQTLGRCAFHTCGAMLSAVIGNNVKLIDEYAFQYCYNLTDVVIGASVDSLAIKAFYDCYNLVNVTCLAPEPPGMYASYSFYDPTYRNGTLHVLGSAIQAYKEDKNWQRFRIIENMTITEQLSLDKTVMTMHGGESQQLTARVVPTDASTALRWTSDDEEVATVDADGLVNAIGPGQAVITATTTDGSGLSATCLVRVLSNGVQDINVLTLPATMTVEKGKPCVLPIGMTNKNAITAVQCDVNLPDGFKLCTDSNGYVIDLLDSRAGASHAWHARQIAPNVVRIFVSSPQSEAFTGNSGNLMLLHLAINDELQDGDYNVALSNVVLADAAAVSYFAPDAATIVTVKSYARGDANGDGTVNVGDYVAVANYIMELEPDPFVFSAADVDENATIDVGDLVGVANIVLGDFVMPDNAPRHHDSEEPLKGASAQGHDPGTGEWAWLPDGKPAMTGQATNDHLFVRGTNQGETCDNVVAFDEGDTKVVWLWLDDDEIYQNQKVQALTPIAYNAAGDLYNEITYNSFQCELYLPEGISLVSVEDEEGDEHSFVQGDRLPNSASIFFKANDTKVIDGVNYRVYTLLCLNTEGFGSHFSAKNAARYKANGALKKDDGALLGLYLRNSNPDAEGELANMIIANLELGFREAFTNDPVWDANDYCFFYCTGGNNESQRFQYYQRIRLFGAEERPMSETPVITSRVNASSVVIAATGKGNVQLKVDGQPVNNPCTIKRGTQDVTVVATATAQEEGKHVSETATATIVVPARVAPTGDNVLTVQSPVMAQVGYPFDLPVALENSAEISALQCDVTLPDGMELAQDGITLVDERATESHTVSVRALGNGTYRILIASPQAEVFNGYEGDLFVMRLNVAADMADGIYNIMLDNIVLADATAVTYNAPDVDATVIVKSYAKGDANGDGLVNVGDYVTTANYIMALNPDPFVFSAADVDDSGTIDVGDLVGIVNITLGDYTLPESTPRHNESNVALTGDLTYMGDNRFFVTLNLDNDVDLTAWQMDLTLPDGMTLTDASLSSRASRHSLVINALSDGTMRLLCSSALNDVVSGHDGVLLTLVLEGDVDDDSYLTVSNAVLAEADMTTHAVNPFGIGIINVAVKELNAGLRIYTQGDNIVVETAVDAPVEIIMVNGMSRTVTAKAGTNVYPVDKGIYIVRAASQVAKLKI